MKKHQHFIPRSYLKNFALETEKDKFMVEAKYRSDEQPKERLISIADICVNKNLYTIPKTDSAKKYALEDFYAQHVDSVYPEIYNWLIDPTFKIMTALQKVKMLMTVMSMFFRTPRFLKFHEERFDTALERAQHEMDGNGRIKFTFDGKAYDVQNGEEENVRQDYHIENKKKFLHSHLEAWHDFTRIKINANVAVSRIYDDGELITSDNPVVIRRMKGRFQSIFDPENMIELPLDNKHYLTIYPNSENVGTGESIGRGSWDKLFALKINYNTEQHSTDWLLGKPNSVRAHVLDQRKYGAHTPENYEMLIDRLEMEKDMKEILRLVQLGSIRISLVMSLK
ncbi:MAG: DUF4238 domain-containing protein [Cyclobacteriaceae bacterium]|nr:DUF4238 domain-containing protein [Cyclobacteriaceae bacterium]